MSFIIVAEDDPVFRGLLTKTLEDAGHVVGAVGDGQAAIRAIALKRPDLAILDMGMPNGSGVDAVRQLRISAADHGLPVIMLTARTSSKDADSPIAPGPTIIFQSRSTPIFSWPASIAS